MHECYVPGSRCNLAMRIVVCMWLVCSAKVCLITFLCTGMHSSTGGPVLHSTRPGAHQTAYESQQQHSAYECCCLTSVILSSCSKQHEPTPPRPPVSSTARPDSCCATESCMTRDARYLTVYVCLVVASRAVRSRCVGEAALTMKRWQNQQNPAELRWLQYCRYCCNEGVLKRSL